MFMSSFVDLMRSEREFWTAWMFVSTLDNFLKHSRACSSTFWAVFSVEALIVLVVREMLSEREFKKVWVVV